MLARNAYRSALAGIPADRPVWKARVLVNLANLAWAQGSPESAFLDFEDARRLAPGDSAVVAGALLGMARCRRRQGQFAEASSLLLDALDAAGTEPGRMIPIAVRLSRLYIERGELREAENLVDQVREGAEQAGGKSLRAVDLDSLADLRLAQGRWNEAMKAAREAVRLALSVHDPVTALQARSASSMVWMHRGEFLRAAREATLARRYSGTDSLVVIALEGVSYRRAKRPVDAHRAFHDLLAEANSRIDRYERDFAAWIFRGVGLCARALDTATESMEPAISAFQQARHRPAEQAPANVLAAQRPSLYGALLAAKAAGYSHVNLDGTLIATDRVATLGSTPGVDLWWSGKHHHHGGNIQVVSSADGWPLWTSEVRPGREHDITCLRHHGVLTVLAVTAAQLPVLADLGYEGETHTLRVPFKKPAGGRLTDDQKSANLIHTHLRSQAERANSLLKTTFKALRRVSLCPQRIGVIVAAALVLLHYEHDRTT